MNVDKRSKMVPKEKSFGVLLEHVDSKIDLVLEGHVALDGKIDGLDKKIEDKFKTVDYKFSIVFDELRIIRNELKEKVSRDEFTLLEKRVAAIEKSRLR